MATDTSAIVLSSGSGGLGAARSLARRGVRVIVVAYESSDPVLHSRFPAQSFAITEGDHEGKETQVLEILEGLPDHGAVILTTSDRMVALLSRNRDRLLKKLRYQLPAPERLDALIDKRKETELVSSLGFAVPKTIQKLPSAPAVVEEQLRYPIIFKPYSYAAYDFFPQKNQVVKTPTALRDFYQQRQQALPFLLAQEVIPGPDSYSWVCSCTFDRNSDMLDCGIKKKLRCLPVHFGGSTYAVSQSNREIVGLARSLGKKLAYVGHASIEFRWDDRDSCYKYIELNPRLPANVGFDEACGMPTVWNSYSVSLHDEVPHSGSEQIDGIYYLDLEGDFFSLRTDGVSTLKIFTIFLKLLFQPTAGLYFAWDDPKPGVVVTIRFVRRAIRGLVRKGRQKLVNGA